MAERSRRWVNCVLPDLSRDLLFRVSFHVIFHRLYSASKSAFPTLVSLSISAFSSLAAMSLG